ncbi:hypothetical protein [Sphingomonas sp. OK281]|uniref:hypothetical protein n=1 Tax=Sphingomonas sp. OK281 TaxID=1881067 RepID=UPI0008EB4217|nr:hypothetical protein [Sphingomonas sp. OK281]SFO46320.1 hypothetical protein SAMN05428984_4397 [Sphingomonas sp. OK281]
MTCCTYSSASATDPREDPLPAIRTAIGASQLLPFVQLSNMAFFGVTRIQNWRRIASNESEFDIVFTAEDSGESYVWKTLVQKEPDGTWVIA